MNIALLIALFFTISTKPAHAYLDPGTGSFLIQIIVGGFLGGIFIIKGYWQRISAFFSKNKQDDSSKKSEDDK
jgi:hypothetical protein